MAYVPPHKRYSKGSGRPIPTPDLLVPHCKRSVNLRTLKPQYVKSGTIVYANGAISRWFAVGLDDGNSVPSAVRLEPVSVESVQKRTGVNPFVMVKNNPEEENKTIRSQPWMSLTANLFNDMLSSFQIVRDEMRSHVMEEMKPTLVARFGKILFRGGPSTSFDNARESRITDATLGDLKRTFYTSVPAHYVDNVVSKVVPKIGLGFKLEKDIYHVKLSDSMRPDATISCKCCVNGDKKLELYKTRACKLALRRGIQQLKDDNDPHSNPDFDTIPLRSAPGLSPLKSILTFKNGLTQEETVELNQVRNMVADISCLSKDLDLRLMLCTRRTLSSLTDIELHNIRNLIGSAVIDPSVQGGLIWPLGNAACGAQYNVVGFWHLVSSDYQSTSIKIKVRYADRYDSGTGTGEASTEVVMKLKGILSALQADNVEAASNMLKDTLVVIWDDFLQCEPFLAQA